MSKTDPAGIEISAKELVVGVKRQGTLCRLRTFPNNSIGHRTIVRWLSRRGVTTRVCMESTGLYGLDLALALDQAAGLELMVANPRAVRRFAEACLQRSKNDRIDTAVLVEFAARMKFQSWQRPAPESLQLRALTRRIQASVESATAQKNQLHAAGLSRVTPKIVAREIKRLIAQIERSIERLEAAALALIRAQPALDRDFALLVSAKGIGKRSALLILAELCCMPRDLDKRQCVAHAGLDPRHVQSGSSIHYQTGISRQGNKYLRRALFMPALSAIRTEPHFRAFYDTLVDKGKAKRQAQVAVMRKILVVLWTMLQNNQPFDPDKLAQHPQTA
ncbi:MAG: IS110 family transposase [Acidobacteriota bacterium]|nr:IS110 family transposase [Acidobacteriota bacterium]